MDTTGPTKDFSQPSDDVGAPMAVDPDEGPITPEEPGGHGISSTPEPSTDPDPMTYPAIDLSREPIIDPIVDPIGDLLIPAIPPVGFPPPTTTMPLSPVSPIPEEEHVLPTDGSFADFNNTSARDEVPQ